MNIINGSLVTKRYNLKRVTGHEQMTFESTVELCNYYSLLSSLN